MCISDEPPRSCAFRWPPSPPWGRLRRPAWSPKGSSCNPCCDGLGILICAIKRPRYAGRRWGLPMGISSGRPPPLATKDVLRFAAAARHPAARAARCECSSLRPSEHVCCGRRHCFPAAPLCRNPRSTAFVPTSHFNSNSNVAMLHLIQIYLKYCRPKASCFNRASGPHKPPSPRFNQSRGEAPD